MKEYQCNKCHHQTSLTAGTIFHSTKLPLTTWMLAIYLITQAKNGISALELKRVLGVSYKTSWIIKQKLMQTMFEREKDRKLSGTIIIDDSYLGGERTGGKVGRGSEGKVPFIAAVKVNEDGKPIYSVLTKVDGFTKAEIEEWAIKHLESGSIVKTDGYKSFSGVLASNCTHKPEVAGPGKQAVLKKCFKWVNVLLGNLKRSLAGTLHAFDYQKYAARYLSEVQYRFNRRFDMASMVIRLATICVRTGCRTESYLRLAEDCN